MIRSEGPRKAKQKSQCKAALSRPPLWGSGAQPARTFRGGCKMPPVIVHTRVNRRNIGPSVLILHGLKVSLEVLSPILLE